MTPDSLGEMSSVPSREEAESRLDELEAMARERDSANNGRDVSQDALARMAIRNTQMKVSLEACMQPTVKTMPFSACVLCAVAASSAEG